MEELAKILVDNGYEFYGWKGSHARFRRGRQVIHLCRPQYNEGLTRQIMRKAGIER